MKTHCVFAHKKHLPNSCPIPGTGLSPPHIVLSIPTISADLQGRNYVTEEETEAERHFAADHTVSTWSGWDSVPGRLTPNSHPGTLIGVLPIHLSSS